MKYLNKLLLIFVIVLFGIVLFFGFSGGWSYIFIFPVLIVFGFTFYYFSKQLQREEKERLEKNVKLVAEEIEAEKWMQDSFVPRVMVYGYKKRWTIIIYGFIFLSGAYFLWEYVNYGLIEAIRAFINAGILFWFFILYVFAAPKIFKSFLKFLPIVNMEKKPFVFLGNKHLSEWGRAYFFLLPVSFAIYFLYPLETLKEHFWDKLITFPVFFLVYTFAFLSLCSIVFVNKDIQDEERKRLEKEVDENVGIDK